MRFRFNIIVLLALSLPTVLSLTGCQGALNPRKPYTGDFEFVYETTTYTPTGTQIQTETLAGTVALGDTRKQLEVHVPHTPSDIWALLKLGEGDSLKLAHDPDIYVGRYIDRDEIIFDGQPVTDSQGLNARLKSALRVD